eukprot:jgi/Undpi1/4957/HiC_scaffold_19.g08309.m1
MRGYALLAVLGRHRQDCSSPGAPASASLGTVVAEGRASNTIDTVFQPSRTLAVLMVADLWVNSLPSQVLPPTAFAHKLKEAAEKQHIFTVMGVIGVALLTSLGMYSFVSPCKAMLLSDLASAFGDALVGACVVFVAAQTAVVIGRRQQEASPSANIFYAKAKRTLAAQVFAICFTFALYVGASSALHLTKAGASTALVALVIRQQRSRQSVRDSEWSSRARRGERKEWK